jgi:hypothetical protein
LGIIVKVEHIGINNNTYYFYDMTKSNKYTDKEFIECVTTSTSVRQVLSKLGLKEAGGNYKSVKDKMEKLNLKLLDAPNNQNWLKGKTHNFRSKPIEYYLTENSYHQSNRLRNRLFKSGLKEKKCECCGITQWNGKPAPLELDHINGINTDNRIENLRILCPNCHAQTDTYRGKNINKNH